MNLLSMSKKMEDKLEKHLNEKKLKNYIERNPQTQATQYFLNPMRPGVKLNKQQRLLRINRYKLKRNKRKWGTTSQTDLKRRSQRNRRLRVQGKFISKARAARLLFGP